MKQVPRQARGQKSARMIASSTANQRANKKAKNFVQVAHWNPSRQILIFGAIVIISISQLYNCALTSSNQQPQSVGGSLQTNLNNHYHYNQHHTHNPNQHQHHQIQSQQYLHRSQLPQSSNSPHQNLNLNQHQHQHPTRQQNMLMMVQPVTSHNHLPAASFISQSPTVYNDRPQISQNGNIMILGQHHGHQSALDSFQSATSHSANNNNRYQDTASQVDQDQNGGLQLAASGDSSSDPNSPDGGAAESERETYEELLSSSAIGNPQAPESQPLSSLSSHITPTSQHQNQNQFQNTQQQQQQQPNIQHTATDQFDRCRDLISLTFLSFRDTNSGSSQSSLEPSQLDCSKLRQQISAAVAQKQNIQQNKKQITSSTTHKPAHSNIENNFDGPAQAMSSGFIESRAPDTSLNGESSLSLGADEQSYSSYSDGQNEPSIVSTPNGVASNQDRQRNPINNAESHLASDRGASDSTTPSSVRASAQFVNQMQKLIMQQQIAQYRQRQRTLKQALGPQTVEPSTTSRSLASSINFGTESTSYESGIDSDTYAPIASRIPTTTSTTSTTSTTTTTTTSPPIITTSTSTTLAPTIHRIRPANGGKRVRPASPIGASSNLQGSASGLISSGSKRIRTTSTTSTTTTTTTIAPADYSDEPICEPGSADYESAECDEILAAATTTTTTPRPRRRGKKNRSTSTTAKPTSTTTLSPGYQPRPDGRIIDYMADPNFPRELKGADLTNYPFYISVPDKIDFECKGRHDGYYANINLHCQIYHHCAIGNRYDFLCPNYTLFDQTTFTCRFINTVDCTGSAKHFDRNNALYIEKEDSQLGEKQREAILSAALSSSVSKSLLEQLQKQAVSALSSATSASSSTTSTSTTSTTTTTTTTTTTQAPRIQLSHRIGSSRSMPMSAHQLMKQHNSQTNSQVARNGLAPINGDTSSSAIISRHNKDNTDITR